VVAAHLVQAQPALQQRGPAAGGVVAGLSTVGRKEVNGAGQRVGRVAVYGLHQRARAGKHAAQHRGLQACWQPAVCLCSVHDLIGIGQQGQGVELFDQGGRCVGVWRLLSVLARAGTGELAVKVGQQQAAIVCLGAGAIGHAGAVAVDEAQEGHRLAHADQLRGDLAGQHATRRPASQRIGALGLHLAHGLDVAHGPGGQ